MKKFFRFSDGLASVVNHICGALILFMSLAVVTSVVGRSLWNISYDWLEELCRYIHILIVMLGIGVVTYRGDQIVMDLLFKSIKGRAHIILDLFNHICVFVFLILGGYWGLQRVGALMKYGHKTSSKVFYSWQPAMTVPIGFLVGALLTLFVIIKLCIALKNYAPEAQIAGNEGSVKEGD